MAGLREDGHPWVQCVSDESLVRKHGGHDCVLGYEVVFFGNIDLDKSITKNPRYKGRLNEEAVSKYQADMKQGDAFPAIVLYRQEGKKDRILGGVTRSVAASRLGWDGIYALVVIDLTPSQQDTIALDLNTINGRQEDPAFVEAIVIKHIIGGSMTRDTGARILRISQDRMRDKVENERFVASCEAKGIDLRKAPPSIDCVKEIRGIENPSTRFRLAEVAAEFPITKPMVTAFKQDVLAPLVKDGTEAEMLAAVEAFKKNIAPTERTRRNPHSLTDSQRLVSDLSRLACRLNKIASLGILTEEEYAQVQKAWATATEKMGGLFKESKSRRGA